MKKIFAQVTLFSIIFGNILCSIPNYLLQDCMSCLDRNPDGIRHNYFYILFDTIKDTDLQLQIIFASIVAGLIVAIAYKFIKKQ